MFLVVFAGWRVSLTPGPSPSGRGELALWRGGEAVFLVVFAGLEGVPHPRPLSQWERGVNGKANSRCLLGTRGGAGR